MKQVLQKEVEGLEQKLEAVLQQWQPAQLKSVGSIKGIGKRATAMLIVFTQGFKNTHNHRQLISFAGMAPTEYSSGSSIHGKPRIYKKGGKALRGCALHVRHECYENKHCLQGAL
jgi:transposase